MSRKVCLGVIAGVIMFGAGLLIFELQGSADYEFAFEGDRNLVGN